MRADPANANSKTETCLSHLAFTLLSYLLEML
jgi:hypothetical protein